MTRAWSRAPFAVTVFVLGVATSHAQVRIPRAEVTPLAGADAAAAGEPARLALQVTLPEGFHVNANKPRDPSLIPIVLTVEPTYRERPVVRVLRPTVHEDDHRRDDRLTLDVRHIEALDAKRQALEIQHLAELLEIVRLKRDGITDAPIGERSNSRGVAGRHFVIARKNLRDVGLG